MKRAHVLWAILVIATVVVVGLWRSKPADVAAPVATEQAPAFSSAAFPAPARARVPVSAQPVELSPEDAVFIDQLRKKFASRMDSPHTQIKLIEQVIAYLMEHYPGDWQSRAHEFLLRLFPELAEQLFEKFEKLVGFNDWLREHREQLLKLPPQERREALWSARRAAFGDAAEEIWRGEIRNEKLMASLASLDQLQGSSTDEKLSNFLGAVQQAYGDDAPQFIEASQTELVSRFVGVASVQAELHALPRSQQHATLRRVRSAVGMDDAALQRWDALDQARDQAWDAGQSYQLQREALMAQYSGEEQVRRLTALQNQMFGTEADTLRSEEAAGFFRFASQRRIGRE